ncbi:MAG TPA: tRNA (adenosine(37)-N6)-threonylcarbamoyltransferase complex dimerization subunit type 1 TsaB [Puia sp.]|jgi:tRNA threonylcarbamoyladenosine biosynthesis protein TsaB|nr:tRNA (adenosine(37)-N6)-threonylcarbamoyltransferase complex dimerization subunit type 1 TsaB [Puia sp.]
MALILNIDTATEKAGIGLSMDGNLLSSAINEQQKDHASWLHPAVHRLIGDTGFTLKDLHAVAVTAGPGSYTGLRVGMAAAKGFCYALDIPLITENELKVMAFTAREQFPGADFYCPMIDARRMEVFTTVYQTDLVALMPTVAMIIDAGSFSDYLSRGLVSFFGDGSGKCKPIITASSAVFNDIKMDLRYLGMLSFYRYLQQEFTGVAYSEPAYTKEFYTHTKK